MAKAKNGDTVKVHYTGRLDDGTVFDSSKDRSPMEFKLGEGKLIPGFEKAVDGMAPGESKTVNIAADDAYGQYRDELKQEVPRQSFPDEVEPEVGQRYQIDQGNGQIMLVSVAEMNDTNVTLDANHPLAGKDLTFEIELVEIA